MERFTAKKQEKLLSALERELGVGYALAMRALKAKDVKINGVRVKENAPLSVGDVVEFYGNVKRFDLDIAYEDENALLVIKPFKTDVEKMTELIEKEKGYPCVPCHRLDTNTQGLMLFAKNEEAERELVSLIRARKIEKKYLAVVFPRFTKSGDRHGFMTRDEKLNLSFVSDRKTPSSLPVTTIFRVVRDFEDCSLVEATLVTGRTHQIRAHLKSLGYSILGDGKYGNGELNKRYGLKNQELLAYSLGFPTLCDRLEKLSERTIKIKNFEKYLSSVNFFE